MRKLTKGITGLLLGMLLSSPLFAKEMKNDFKVSLSLSSIERIRATESSGDELYFSITEYPSMGRPSHYLIPEFPMHWLSNYLKDVKNVILWDKVVKAEEGASVLISLIEQDAPPWNMDDLIGTIKLKVRNEAGQLKQEWTIPNQQDTQPVLEHENEFELRGSGGDYKVSLKVNFS